MAATAFVWFSLGDINQQLQQTPRLQIPQLARTDVGGAQTILLIGADTRWSDRRAGQRGRSDTMILMRLDPDKPQVSVLSIPRDLRIQINGYTQKFNASYELGGASGVVTAIKNNLGVQVNHVFEISFGAFSGLVDSLGCSYVDIDRRYYHSNAEGGEQYSEINLQPGYQKLCGTNALQYVRYRHTDTDDIRSLRQQDFLHQLSAQYGANQLLEKRDQLLALMGRYVSTDLRGRLEIADMLRLLAFCSSKPVYQVQWQGTDQIVGGIWYALASPQQIRSNVDHWENPPWPTTRNKKKMKPKHSTSHRQAAASIGMESALRWSHEQARLIAHPAWPIYLPARRVAGSQYVDGSPRAYTINDQLGNPHPAYRATLVDANGYYWGIQGVGWETPPLLQMVHETVQLGSRQLQYYWDGGRMRFCAWQKDGWWYWVSNSLPRTISSAQIIDTCRSFSKMH